MLDLAWCTPEECILGICVDKGYDDNNVEYLAFTLGFLFFRITYFQY